MIDKIPFGLPTVSNEAKKYGIERGISIHDRFTQHETEFKKQLVQKEKEATEQKKTFCRPCAIENYKDQVNEILKELNRKRSMGTPITQELLDQNPIKMDWEKFEQLKEVAKTFKTYKQWAGGEPIVVTYKEYRCAQGHGQSIQIEEKPISETEKKK